MKDIITRRSPILTGTIDSPFEKIKRLDKEGAEYWSARELAKLLEYQDYRNFVSVIEKATTSCVESNVNVEDHFVEITEMVTIGSGATRKLSSMLLSRYACYLVIQNADPTDKEIVALGQTYFAIQTRRQEVTSLALEDEKRLSIRGELSEHNKQLAGAAKKAGVIEPLDYAIFQDHGYRGLYRKTSKEIHRSKGLKKSQKILDHMGSTELAANLFRATQTEEKIKRENIRDKNSANSAHYEVGNKVRQTIRELGGTMPENLPVHDSIKKIERKKQKLLSHQEETED